MDFIVEAVAVIIVAIGLVRLIQRNMRQRPRARKLRGVFISAAEDLVAKPEFPEEAAKFLIMLTSVPAGWLTRGMFAVLVKEMLLGTVPDDGKMPAFETVPPQLRVKYVQALLALALSDSYRCALLGRLWRGANLWVLDAVNEPKADVNAHATRRVVAQVAHVRTPRYVEWAPKLDDCVAA